MNSVPIGIRKTCRYFKIQNSAFKILIIGERGSAMLEALIGTTILVGLFVGILRLGFTALDRQNAQAAVDNRAWSAAFNVTPSNESPNLEQEWLGYRANDPSRGLTSLRIDRGD